MNNLSFSIWPCVKLVPLRVCENMQGRGGRVVWERRVLSVISESVEDSSQE